MRVGDSFQKKGHVDGEVVPINIADNLYPTFFQKDSIVKNGYNGTKTHHRGYKIKTRSGKIRERDDASRREARVPKKKKP